MYLGNEVAGYDQRVDGGVDVIRGCLLASVLAAALLALTAGGSAALPRPPQATVKRGWRGRDAVDLLARAARRAPADDVHGE